VYVPVLVVIDSSAVVKVAILCVPGRVQLLESVGRHGHSEIPELHALVLAIAKNVAPITLAVDIRQAFDVANECSSFSVIAHTSPVPDLDCCVVRSRVENVGRHLVGETDGIDIVLMPTNVVQNRP
jgi:hypothetical protein